MFARIKRDIQVICDRDPAARSCPEILFCYSGLHALWFHRIAHWLWLRHLRVLARFISQVGRSLTGIEIHPGATIGQGLFIDHGMGVVIGETTEIGDNVTLYQGVTLGGTGKQRGKRHPTLGNHVVIGVGAKVLGNITIGDHSIVGANAVVLKSVPPNCTAVGVPARVVVREGVRVYEDEVKVRDQVPDVVGEELDSLRAHISELEQRLRALEENRERMKAER